MRVIVLILFLFTVSCSTLRADEPDSVKNHKLMEKIYDDAKGAVNSIAKSLKVGAEHVYEVLVKQQIVKSVTNSIIALMMVILLIIAFRFSGKGDWVNGDIYAAYCIVFCVISGLMFMYTMFNIKETVTGFINPEYGAIEKIFEVIKGN